MDYGLLKLLFIPFAFSLMGLAYAYRARAMRALAARSGLQYVGPSAPKWFGLPKIKPRLPISRNWFPANEIRQVLNVIEGEQDGVRVLVFDFVLDRDLGTLIAAQTGRNVFEKDAPGERVLKSRDWRILYSTNAFPWAMGVPHVERHLKEVRSDGSSELSVDDASAAPAPVVGFGSPGT